MRASMRYAEKQKKKTQLVYTYYSCQILYKSKNNKNNSYQQQVQGLFRQRKYNMLQKGQN